MPTDATPEPAPFGGFRPHLTLSKDEVLDVIITLDEAIEVLAGRELFEQARSLPGSATTSSVGSSAEPPHRVDVEGHL